MEFKIVREAAALNNLVTKVIKAGQSYREQLHIAVVSALYHAAEHGQTAPLGRLYDSLTSNDQTALRGSYIRRIHAACGGLDWADYINPEDGKNLPVPAEILASAQEAGSWLTYSEKNGFAVKQQVQPARDAFKKLAEEKLINPEPEKGWTFFYSRNNLSEIQQFGNKQVLQALTALVNNASGKSERKTADVDTKILAEITKVHEYVKTFMETNGAAATVDDNATRSRAQRKRRTPADEGVALQ
jgi:hypothetical protein